MNIWLCLFPLSAVPARVAGGRRCVVSWAAAADSNGGADGDAPARATATRNAFGRSHRLPPSSGPDVRLRPRMLTNVYVCLRETGGMGAAPRRKRMKGYERVC